MSTFARRALARQPAGVARREVVDDEHLEAVADERVHDVRADEARPARHECAFCHYVSLRRFGATTYDSSASAMPARAPSTIATPRLPLLPPAVTFEALPRVMICVSSTYADLLHERLIVADELVELVLALHDVRERVRGDASRRAARSVDESDVSACTVAEQRLGLPEPVVERVCSLELAARAASSCRPQARRRRSCCTRRARPRPGRATPEPSSRPSTGPCTMMFTAGVKLSFVTAPATACDEACPLRAPDLQPGCALRGLADLPPA